MEWVRLAEGRNVRTAGADAHACRRSIGFPLNEREAMTQSEARAGAASDQGERVETLLVELSAHFISLAPEQLDREIQDAQRRICEYLGFDRSSLFQQSAGDPAALLLTHVYQRPEMPPRPLGEFDAGVVVPWVVEQLRQLKTITICKLDDLPAEATRDRESLRQYGTRSLVVIPLPIGRGELGALTFASARERKDWPETLVKRLQLVAEVFANAIARARSDRALRESEEQLRRTLEELHSLRDQLQRQNVYLKHEVELLHGHTRIVGQSQALKRVLAQVEQVAPTGSTVLLLGETGTGKELIASAIHDLSPRRDQPMVRVSCSAIPTSLIESELFGREKGAYTGALSNQVGRFELADGSTLFLDEIGDLPSDVQVKLLRVLEGKQIERLGSPRSIPVDVRIIAATHHDLEEAVREGRFREDLYYRLNVFPITVPPLRDRPEDIPALVSALVGELGTTLGKNIESIPRESLDALQRYNWPGNVRELRNVVERAMIVVKGPNLWIEPPGKAAATLTPRMTMEELEREHILRVLEMSGWRVRGKGGAAEILGLKPTTLESRMAKLGIHRRIEDRTK
jgi:transcriptional regulator with GAF, ATPase, and Fis domain